MSKINKWHQSDIKVENFDTDIVSYNIKTYRQKHGLSQQVLAFYTGLSIEVIRKYEQGRIKAPTYFVLSKLGYYMQQPWHKITTEKLF